MWAWRLVQLACACSFLPEVVNGMPCPSCWILNVDPELAPVLQSNHPQIGLSARALIRANRPRTPRRRPAPSALQARSNGKKEEHSPGHTGPGGLRWRLAPPALQARSRAACDPPESKHRSAQEPLASAKRPWRHIATAGAASAGSALSSCLKSSRFQPEGALTRAKRPTPAAGAASAADALLKLSKVLWVSAKNRSHQSEKAMQACAGGWRHESRERAL